MWLFWTAVLLLALAWTNTSEGFSVICVCPLLFAKRLLLSKAVSPAGAIYQQPGTSSGRPEAALISVTGKAEPAQGLKILSPNNVSHYSDQVAKLGICDVHTPVFFVFIF